MKLAPLRLLALVALTLGTTSLAHAQYGTVPPYGGGSGYPAPSNYGGQGYGNQAAPTQALPVQAVQAPGAPFRLPSTINSSNIAGTLNGAEQSQSAQSLLLLYGQAVTQPDLARAAIAQLLNNYYSLRNGARTADQATQAVAEAALRFQVFQAAQNQVMVQQNQQILQQNARIIALLEAQSRARQGGR